MKYLLSLVLIFLLLPNKAYGQELHLGVEPTVLQIDTTPPSNVEAPFAITNLSPNSIDLNLMLIPFESKSDGRINLLINEEANLSSIIKNRLTIFDGNTPIENITLRPGENKQLTLFMDLNEGDPVGDYYFSIVFLSSGTELDDTSSSSIPGGIATNVMISIGPKSEPNATIEEFSTNSYVTSGPMPFNLKLNNTGKYLIQPRGTITIKNILGKEVGKIELLPQYVLADSSRYLIDSSQASPSAEVDALLAEIDPTNPVSIWGEKFLMGPYTATARITLDEGGSVVSETTRFIAFPLQIIAIISGIIFVILGIALRISIKMRRNRA